MVNDLITASQISTLINNINTNIINYKCTSRDSTANSSKNTNENSSYTGHKTNNSDVHSSNGNATVNNGYGS